ncbi:MAG: M48 family metallopeptidase [Clostridia bacterium]|nr:M48 family metallopeptidase [Clostridia bacterium]
MKYKIVYSRIKNVYIYIKDGEIIVKAPRRVSKKEIDKIVKSKENWIKKTLKKDKNKEEKEKLYTDEEFRIIVETTANELIKETGLIPNKVRIRDIKYAWGSCSANKNITISYKLISYSKQAIKYVVLHELCHIKYMNHSKDFWDLVEIYMPNYKEIKKEFK